MTSLKNKRWFKIISILIVIFLIQFTIIDLTVVFKANKYAIDNSKTVPDTQCIIVFGAYVYSDGTPCDMLKDRLDTALEILKNSPNKDIKVIVTGDHGKKNYDEVNAMRKYLMENGVEDSKIFMDHAGFSTYESIYRARDIFKVESAVVVTQNYHLKRATYLARNMGIEAYGIKADKHNYVSIIKYSIRESLAIYKDFFKVNVLKSKPTFLGDEIPINSSDSSVTHD